MKIFDQCLNLFFKVSKILCFHIQVWVLFSSRIGHLVGDFDAKLSQYQRHNLSNKIYLIIITSQDNVNPYVINAIRKIKRKKTLVLNLKKNLYILFESYAKNKKSKNVCFVYGKTKLYKFLKDSPCIFKSIKKEQSGISKYLSDHNKKNKPLIVVHNRCQKYLGPGFSYHNHRDFSVSAFYKIFEKYGSQYYFLRIGRSAEEKVAQKFANICYDFPFSNYSPKADFMSHMLAEFYFGSDSGANCPSLAFRKPIAGINYQPNCFSVFRELNYYSLGFIIKKMQCKSSGELIGLKAMYQRKLRNLWSNHEFANANVELISNSEYDVLEFFDECHARYTKKICILENYSDEQKEFWSIVRYYEPETFRRPLILDGFFIGESFLKKNKYLIE